jgi:NTP pyrophosphatase (non-canonical NTP hydrolase)
MKDALLIELAATWELQADTGGDGLNKFEPAAREALRMCADCLRMLVDASPVEPAAPLQPPSDAAYQFEVWLGDEFCASGDAPSIGEMRAEASRYAAQYAQDGPIDVLEFVRHPLAAAPAPDLRAEMAVGLLPAMGYAWVGDAWVATAAPAQPAAQPEPFQARMDKWLLACFGEVIARDKSERNHRFLEEALELVQSAGCTVHEAHQLVDYTYGRPAGDMRQEVGGVVTTLAALCQAQDIDMEQAAEDELARIWTKVEKIRAKQAAKPKHSPLPEAAQPEPPLLALLAKERQRIADADRTLRQARQFLRRLNGPDTALAQEFNNILHALGTYESDHEANQRREDAAQDPPRAHPVPGGIGYDSADMMAYADRRVAAAAQAQPEPQAAPAGVLTRNQQLRRMCDAMRPLLTEAVAGGLWPRGWPGLWPIAEAALDALAAPAQAQAEALTDDRILEVATRLFPRWREDIQPRFVLELARGGPRRSPLTPKEPKA